MSVNSRNKGHAFEQWFVNVLKVYGYYAETSRYANRKLDDLKVDIVDDTDFYFQLKAVERMEESYHKLLKSMPTNKVPVVVHKKNNQGVIIAMKLTDFQNLLLYRKTSNGE